MLSLRPSPGSSALDLVARVRCCGGAALLAMLALLAPRWALAQHCHVGSDASQEPGVELAVRAETARFRTTRYEGSYEGVFLRGAWSTRNLAFAASLPHYHIVRNGLGSSGFGDLLLEGRGTFVSSGDRRVSAGGQLAFSAPTGDSTHDLGMGHWMLAPTVWGSLTREPFTFEARLGYGRAFGGGAHHQHVPGAMPIVDPMNQSELEAVLSGAARAHRNLQTRVALMGATPTPSSDGTTRGAASFAADFLLGQGRLSLEAQLPLVGDAFRGKLAAELGFRF